MRQAYKVWAGIAAGVFCLVAVVDLSDGSSSASTATSPTMSTYLTTAASSTPTAVAALPYSPTTSDAWPTYTTSDYPPSSEPDPYTGYASTPSYSADPGYGASDPVYGSSGSSDSGSGGSAYYKNCAAARAAGVAPLHRGDPGYSSKLDRDGDGTACE